jgi:hypothetical protein
MAGNRFVNVSMNSSFNGGATSIPGVRLNEMENEQLFQNQCCLLPENWSTSSSFQYAGSNFGPLISTLIIPTPWMTL